MSALRAELFYDEEAGNWQLPRAGLARQRRRRLHSRGR
jgi:hypothetical protein